MSAPEVTRVEVSPGETPEAAGVVRSQARLALDHEGEGDPSHGAWVLWVEDDGLESRVCATRWGVRDTERRVCVLARGARGGFALGDAVAMPGGEGAFCWRGDEGFAWMVCVDRDGRFRSQRFVAPCEGAPSLARIDGELLLVFTAPDGGVRATAAHSAGSPVERWRGPDGSHSPCAVAIKGRGVAVAFVDVAGSVQVRDPRDNSLAECAKASERARAHAPALVHDGSWWLAVWVSEDTGRLSLCVASAFGTTMRVAEVWAPLDRPWSSAPSLALRGGEGAWLAWREERGPRPGVYARGLDRVGRRVGEELRVSDRASRATPGRVGLAAGAERWCGAYAEETEEGRSRVGVAGGAYPERG